MKRGIAFFDFDGTITKKDSLLEFIRFARGNLRFYAGMLWLLPYLILFKIKLISHQKAKERVLSYFFRDTSIEDFDRLCHQFGTRILPRLIRPGALEELHKLQHMGYIIVIVSASPENWIRLWALEQGAEVIASQLEVKAGKLTGRLIGKNCHGPEKVRRIKEKYAIDEYDEIFAYGDSSGDRPMLKLAHTAYFKPFRS